MRGWLDIPVNVAHTFESAFLHPSLWLHPQVLALSVSWRVLTLQQRELRRPSAECSPEEDSR